MINKNDEFIAVSPSDLTDNFFTKISKDWVLITVKDGETANPMTASWGGVGHIWGKDVTFCFIRQSRHTYSLIENSEYYSLCFLENNKENKKTLAFCGKNSGRDFDKAAETGLNIASYKTENGENVPFWLESSLVFVCQKMHHQDLKKENFDLEKINEFYETGDYHRMYIGEIVAVLKRK